MRDAISETFDLTVLLVVVFVVCMIIAFAVNYSKAYRMKQYAISVIEKNNCESLHTLINYAKDDISDEINSSLVQEAKRIGYAPNVSEGQHGNYVTLKSKVTIKIQPDAEYDEYSKNGYSFKKLTVITYVGLDIPFVNDIFNFGYIKLSSDTNYCQKINSDS